jgi:hypothetical protein
LVIGTLGYPLQLTVLVKIDVLGDAAGAADSLARED